MKRVKQFLLIVIISTILLTLTSVYADTFVINSEADFNKGTYNQTHYNTSVGAIILNYSASPVYNTSGNYTSQIFNASSSINSSWDNITWWRGYGWELPNYKASEDYIVNAANMTNNVLLFHLNNDSAYGENDTHVYDFSGNGNNGTVTDATFNSTGKLRGAFDFDGSGDYIKIDQSSTTDLVNNFTIAMWINPKNQAGRIIDNNNRYGLYYDATWKRVSSVGNGVFRATSSSNSVPLNTWTQVVIIYDSTDGHKIYVNGASDGTDSYNFDITNHGDLYIAKYATSYFKGLIDEIAIYNRTLSATEIEDIYKRGALELNLIARSCDDDACSGEGWTDVIDTSPQDLSLNNNTYFQYKFDFETDNETYTPKLYNITISYTITAVDNSPNVTLNYPTADYSDNTSDPVNVTFNCSATDDNGLTNISLYITDSINQSFDLNQTTNVSGTDNSTTWTLSLNNGNYTWNCLAYDSADNNDWDDNRTIEVNYIAPYCGDGSCNGDETCSNCAQDCGNCPPTEENPPPSGGGGGSSSGYYGETPTIVEEILKPEETEESVRYPSPEETEEEPISGVIGEAIHIAPNTAPNPIFAVPTILLMIIFIAVITLRHSDISDRAKKILTVAHGSLILMIALFVILSFKSIITDYFNLGKGNILDISGNTVANFVNNPLPMIAITGAIIGVAVVGFYIHNLYISKK